MEISLITMVLRVLKTIKIDMDIWIEIHIISCNGSAHIGLSWNAPEYFSLTSTYPNGDDKTFCSFLKFVPSNM